MFLKYFSVIKPSGAALDDEDEDVAKERRRVMSGGAEEDVLKIQELTKVVKTFDLNRSISMCNTCQTHLCKAIKLHSNVFAFVTRRLINNVKNL